MTISLADSKLNPSDYCCYKYYLLTYALSKTFVANVRADITFVVAARQSQHICCYLPSIADKRQWARLALSIATCANGETNFSLAKQFKNLSPNWRNDNYGQIANIRSDVIQILVRLYFISYATVTVKFRITKMTTRSLAAAIFVRASLSRCIHNCGSSRVFLTG